MASRSPNKRSNECDSRGVMSRKIRRGENIAQKVYSSVKHIWTFSNVLEIENKIDEVVQDGDNGKLKISTIDRTRLRNKYFFGERYTYGKGGGLGSEVLFPRGSVDPIPEWVFDFLIRPLEDAGVLIKGFVNSAVINLYSPGGCIVSHIDPPQIFDRPIISVSFLSDSLLCFGCKFTFKPLRVSPPIAVIPLIRGSAISLSGFSADCITHCVRPEDLKFHRAAIILRRVLPDAPRILTLGTFATQPEVRSLARLQRKRKSNLTLHLSAKKRRLQNNGWQL